MSRATVEALRKQAMDELARRRGAYTPKLPITLSTEQEAFIADKSLRKIGRCGRRAGKTVTMIVYYIRTMINKPKARCLYLALTRDQAKEIVWEPVLWMLKEAGIRHTASKSRKNPLGQRSRPLAKRN